MYIGNFYINYINYNLYSIRFQVLKEVVDIDSSSSTCGDDQVGLVLVINESNDIEEMKSLIHKYSKHSQTEFIYYDLDEKNLIKNKNEYNF